MTNIDKFLYYSQLIAEAEISTLPNSLNIPRHKMPQISNFHIRDYIQFLQQSGVEVVSGNIPVKNLKPTQHEINVDKVKRLLRVDNSALSKPVIISKDNYLLDGHHRAYALYTKDPAHKIRVIRVNTDIRTLLRLSHTYPNVYYSSIEN